MRVLLVERNSPARGELERALLIAGADVVVAGGGEDGLARVGADDFMPRGSSIGELHARLRALARRGTNGSTPSRLQFEELALDVGEQSARIGERAVRLTRTEFDFAPAGNTLRVYMGYLRRKLEANAERRLLHTVRGVSYVLREP